MADDNKTKSLNGSHSKQALLSIIRCLQDDRLIKHSYSDYRCGYPGKSDTQFYAPFCLEFFDGSRWLLFSTNSIRNDRSSIQQWNAHHIKQIDSRVSKAFFVIPDDVKNNDKERAEADKYHSRITSGEYYTAIDGVIYQGDLVALVTEYIG